VRILINECLPTRCRTWFPGHTVGRVEFRGWKGVLNGALLARAVVAGFEVLLTADRRMVRQHDFSKRLSILNRLRGTIFVAVERATPGDYIEVPGPRTADETLDGSETAP
jgi:hypothetical protein